jgi:hypothetical protein
MSIAKRPRLRFRPGRTTPSFCLQRRLGFELNPIRPQGAAQDGIPKFRNMCYGRAVARSNGMARCRFEPVVPGPEERIACSGRSGPCDRRRARIKVSAKFAHNQLKRLISDERIQGNPSFSNRHKRGFSHQNGGEPRKPKQADLPRSRPNSAKRKRTYPSPCGSVKAPCATRWKSRRRTKASFRDGRAWPNRRSTVQERNREVRCRSRR